MLQKMKELITTPIVQVTLCLLLVGVVVGGLLYVKAKKDEIRPAIVPVRNTAEIIYTGKLDTIEAFEKATEGTSTQKFRPPVTRRPTIPDASNNISEQRQEGNTNPHEPQKTTVTEEQNAPVTTPSMPSRPKGKPLQMVIYKSNSSAKEASGDYAPFGRMLRCELSYSVSTASLTTPLIGVVTEALWWDGKEIIPVGCEVHGSVAGAPSRDRIGTSNSWKLIFPFRDATNGNIMDIQGIALDCNKTEEGWAKSDGTAGIRGKIISNQEQMRLNAALATFISGLGEGMSTTEYDYIGNSTIETSGGTWKDAFGKALQQTGKQLAQELLKEASQNVYYVEAEAGTEFYIYITQPLDTDMAQRAQISIPHAPNNKRTQE